jgi:hypothetical protein
MKERTENGSLLVRYLLAQLPEGERDQIEDRYAVDDDFFEELLIVESELIDRYLQEELSDPERRQFEASFLNSPSRRVRIDSARVMMKGLATASISTVPPASRKVRSWFPDLSGFWRNRTLELVTGITILAAALTFSWIIIKNSQRSPVSPHQIVSVDLAPNAVRSSNELPTLEIRPGVSVVEFHLYLERSVQGRFNATLQTATGKTMGREVALEVQNGRTVIVSLPADVFSSGDYVITLANENDSGTSDITAEYHFKIVKP